jgi:C-terminal processing protease CtpA/Prc
MNRLITIIRTGLFLAFLLVAVVPQAFGQEPNAPVPPPAAPLVKSDTAKRQEAFEIVWQTVNDSFYDPKFGGVDWAQVRERYQPQVAKVSNDREFHQLLQQMLNELHQSHFMVIPREAIPKIRVAKSRSSKQADEPDDSADEDSEPEEPLDSLNYKLADRLLTGIGIEIRVLNGSAVVTRVEAGS